MTLHLDTLRNSYITNSADKKAATNTAARPSLQAQPQENITVDTDIPKVPGCFGAYIFMQVLRLYTSTSPKLSGGDVDAAWEQADSTGEEAVGGTAATPDQNIVDQLGAAVGLEIDDMAFLHTVEIIEERDDRRWELDPTSSEDYQERHSI
nr:DUF6335 family protein [Planktothrix sp. FACHB-1355]